MGKKIKIKREWGKFFRLILYNLGETLKKISGSKSETNKADKKSKKK